MIERLKKGSESRLRKGRKKWWINNMNNRFHYNIQLSKNLSCIQVQMKDSPNNNADSFDPKDYVTKNLTLKEVLLAKDAFDEFDTDQSGTIDIRYMKNVMSALGFYQLNSAIFQMISDLDPDGDGTIDFKLWLHMMTNKMSSKPTRADIAILFGIMDEQRKGTVSAQDLKKSAKYLDIEISALELNEMILRADRDNDGQVSAQDFYLLMSKPLSYQ